jgi:hypothetical protein
MPRAWLAVVAFAAGCASPASISPEEAKAEAEARVARARGAQEAAARSESQHRAQFESGTADEESLFEATAARLLADRDLARRELEWEETKRTGRPAQRAVDAPKVDGRDFVLEAYRLEEAQARRRVEHAVARSAHMNAQHKTGLVPWEACLPLDGAAARARVERERWTDLVAVRMLYEAHEIDREEAQRAAARARNHADVEDAHIRVRTARRMLKTLRGQYNAGLRDYDEVAAAESALQRALDGLHEARMGR